MKRIQGQPNTPIIECIDKQTRYAVRWDYVSSEQGEETIWTFMEEIFPVRPTIAQIKEIVYEWINNKATASIVSTFVYNNVHVWLSNENQQNYAATYSLLTNGVNILPVRIKGGSDEQPEYIQFDTAEDFCAFWIAARNHINMNVQAAWAEKSEYDFSPYETELNKL
jgi:hypothetical protein